MSKKLWGGRFSGGTHPDVEAYTASIHFDAKLAKFDILGSLAHVTMLEKCQILTAAETQSIKGGLIELLKKISNNEITFSLQDEDIHMNIERHLQEAIGEVAGKLHTARSRN